MPTDKADLIAQLKCPNTTWEDLPASSPAVEQRPINCVSYYLAYAFCIWEGGRLPTEAEWNYAAAGGDEQRVYPWSAPADDATITSDHAVYKGGASAQALPNTVGSKSCTSNLMSCGDGRWGQADLAGNVLEWNLDYFADPYPTTSCVDCWNTSAQTTRSLRGGDYRNSPDLLLSSLRWDQDPTDPTSTSGFRCVYELKL